ncbi:O-antigen ligase family protein [Paraconexibacter antarcticus]|uniref:O-antigen ligase family protein n=1 Tax=Paraconexibacter antarcticus TaxID=2949664 RepID=A0ABY5DLA2_9ACTN|nr:O-antigen ligase family protein [Paraconexibacter antarcticus]UTI62600.1 O-antigen ligase family protein [Paraconexibacter antarcticus]
MPSTTETTLARTRLPALTPWLARGAKLGGPVLSVLPAALIVLAASRSGGYFAEDYLLVGALAFGASAVAISLADPQWRPTQLALVTLAALVALAAWTGLSAGWSPDPEGARLAMARTLGYVAAFGLAVLAVGDGRHARLVLRLLVAALVGIAVVALLGRLRADLFATDSAVSSPAPGRLGSVITYWNGLGAVAAMAVMGAIGLAGDAREAAAVRVLAAAGGVIATCTLYLTLSRGTGLALAAGVLVVLGLSPRRGRLGLATVLILGGGLAGILILRHHPILVDAPGTAAARRHEGGTVLLWICLIAAAAGATQLALGRLRLRRPATSADAPPRVGPHALVGGAVAVAVLLTLVGTYAAVGDRVEGRANDSTGGVRSFVNRQYESFMNPIAAPAAGQARLDSVQSSRSDAYRVALDGFRAHPLAGDGAAGFRVRWFRERRGYEDLRNAHSLELETLSELGIVGAGILLTLIGCLLSGMRALLRRRGTVTRSQGAAAGGIVVVWLVHSALDWDWQQAAVTLPALTAGALLMAPDRMHATSSGRRRRRRRRSGVGAGAVR